MAELTVEEQETLRALEESLWVLETRADTAHMADVLAPGFEEFGRSGRTYSRDEVLAPFSERFETELPLPEYRCALVSEDVALATYISRVRYPDGLECANRSSLWVRDGGSWRLRFHQGTPLPPAR